MIDPSAWAMSSASTTVSGNLIAHYTYGLGLVSQVTSGGTSSYYDFDAIGSTVGITNSAGHYVNTYSY